MNPKIQKLRAELDKNTEKITKLQVRNTEIKQQIRELENADIIGLVRTNGVNIEELAQFLQMLQTDTHVNEKEETEIDS